MTGRRWSLVVVTALALLFYSHGLAPTTGKETPPPLGEPMARSLKHVFNRASQEPGSFKAIGYLPFVAGIEFDDLFDIPPGDQSAPVNESNARFAIVQEGFQSRVVPNTFLPPRPGENNTMRTAIAGGPHYIYYDLSPQRDWTRPETFSTGELVAIWDHKLVTTFVDLQAQIGVGTDVVALTFSKQFTLASGQTFDFAQLGSRLIADSQLQLATGLTSPYPDLPVVVGESEVWKLFAEVIHLLTGSR